MCWHRKWRHVLTVKQFTEVNKTLGKLEGAIKNGQIQRLRQH